MAVSQTVPDTEFSHRGQLPFGVILVAVWAIPAALAVIETYTFARMSGRPFSLAAIVLREGTTWATYGLLAPVVFRLATRFPLRPPLFRAHLSLHFASGVIMAALAAVTATVAMQLTVNSTDVA